MPWKCRVCTLENESNSALCAACGIPQGECERWVELKDPKSGKPYYYDEVSKVTQWERPNATVTRAVARTPERRGTSPTPSTSPRPTTSPTNDTTVQVSAAPTFSSVNAGTPEGTVRCPRCTFLNNANQPSCTMCGSPVESASGSWRCRSCTLQNAAGSQECSACGDRQGASSPAPAATPSREDSIKKHIQRRIQSNPRQHSDPMEGSLRDPRDCRRCTFRNPPGWVSCQVCSYTNAVDVPKNGVTPGGAKFSFAKQMAEWMGNVEGVEAKLGRRVFVDDTFPPTKRSLYGSDTEESFGQHDNRDVSGWQRFNKTKPRSRSSNKPWTFAQKDQSGTAHFSPEAIQQGQLGDCWFLSALAVVCTRQELIRRIFITQDIRQSGVYSLRFWHNGIWTPVLVDDHLPTTSWGGIAFAAGADNQLWPALVEKAYAKLYGSYKAICGGTAADALTDLTGAPSTKVKLDEASEAGELDMTWLQLTSSASSGFLMAASSGKKGASREAYKAVGLISNHCYTLLQVTDEIGVRLLKLRNPWGKEEWRGDWGDSSPLWTQQIRDFLGHSAKNDGTFWMAFPDFIKYFTYVDICKTHEDWFQQSVSEMFTKKVVPSGTAQFSRPYVLRVSTPTWLFLSMVQQDERGAPMSYHYQDAGLTVVKLRKETANLVDPQHFETVGGSLSQVQRITTVELILQTGCYVVFPFSLLNMTHDMRFTLALWSSKELKLQRAALQGLHPVVSSMHGLVKMKDAKGVKFSHPFPGVKIGMIKDSHSIWFYVENSTRNGFEIALDCSGSAGLVASRGLVTKDTLAPGTCMLINMLTSVSAYSWSYQIKQRYRLGNLPPMHSPPLPSAHHLHQVMYLTK